VPKNTLRRNLERLHRELASGEPMDAETRALLARIAEDIEQVLDESPPEDGGLGDRLENATIRFEASHPRLARALSEVTDALAKLGI
jgi:formate dehydrogenase maturation protein FdhE